MCYEHTSGDGRSERVGAYLAIHEVDDVKVAFDSRKQSEEGEIQNVDNEGARNLEEVRGWQLVHADGYAVEDAEAETRSEVQRIGDDPAPIRPRQGLLRILSHLIIWSKKAR